VFNARGCANSELKTPRLFNGARTDDLRTALIAVQEKLGASTPLVGIGFSLGSNILVKVWSRIHVFVKKRVSNIKFIFFCG
jgi:predicted alpha/beta-fold hydrolase